MFDMRSIFYTGWQRMLAATILLLGLSGPTLAAPQLLMFEEDWCHWCELWDDEIGVVYGKTAEGRRAPLRRIDIHGAFPDDVVLVSRPQYTPTFILVEDGREIGRIEGYPGEDFFWGLLARLLDRLPEATGQASDAETGKLN